MFTRNHLQEYRDKGFCVVRDAFAPDEIEAVREALPALFAEQSPRRIVEKGSEAVRSVYGAHQTHELFARFVRHPRLLGPAEEILGSAAYVHQFRINVKAAFSGDVWQWHQDYIFWREEDGMPEARVTNVALFLDDVTEFNAPMYIIPGSHRFGVIDVQSRDGEVAEILQQAYGETPSWLSNVTSDLRYTLPAPVVQRLVRQFGMASATGPAGSLLFFHPNVAHASTNNVSPFSRMIAMVAYNSVENALRPTGRQRPEFLAARDATPLTAVDDDVFVRVRAM